MINSKYVLVAFLAMIVSFPAVSQSAIESTKKRITSPDGNFVMDFYQKGIESRKKQIHYKLTYKNKPVILESELGVLIENQLFESALAIENDTAELWSANLDLIKVEHSTSNESWQPLYGERSTIQDHYNEMVLYFEKYGDGNASATGHNEGEHALVYDRRRSYEMQLIVRAYNEGVAFRYHFPETNNGLFLHITGEQTNFTMPEGTQAYFERWAQGPYQLLPLKDWPDESERPLTLTLKNGLVVALTEAEMIDFARTKFKLSDQKANTLETSLYDFVDVITPYSMPWRVIMVAETAGELLENNDIILNLNPENKIANTSWIKPGKVMREVTLTMKGGKNLVDFAAEHNIQYIHLDAGWYGPEMKVSSDATTVSKNKDIDVEQLVDYAAAKDIGVIVYVNQRALVQQLDEILPLYQQWGIKGIKFGFVQVGSDKWTSWMHEAIRKAADHQIMVNVHDEYRPTGFSRTYPNLMTQEGIRGNEEMPGANHNTTLPFTRYLAGAGDYTIAYYSPRIKTTHAHQLAMAVVAYSPLQYLYWYDKPENYQGEPEIDFFDNVKTVWDDTRVISGEIGEHAAIARRSGDDWFVGIITNNEERNLTFPLNFLPKNIKYVANIYVDDEKVNTRTQVSVLKYIVDANDEIEFALKASGGAAIHLEQAKAGDLRSLKKLPKREF